ncbi:hypothetical protein GIB67_018918 [Kingdonia uniflora]|uniref:DUF8040 domain-containing protein n=1 Tax=Kingdonia uniflora TaxID=39325 RepID=A0A7J7L2S4_9MAGN|nr:hypothetical protein GIB67_018918 [Kingdonia uniflora]
MNGNEDHRNNVVVLATATTSVTIAIVTAYLMLDNPRKPYSNKVADRNDHIKWILPSEKRCRWNLRMGREPFHHLCALIKDRDLLRDTRICNVEEQLMRLLHILGHNVRHRVLEGRYYRSLETISHQFNEVLHAIVKLYNVLIVDHGEIIHNGKVQTQVTDNPHFTPYFMVFLFELDPDLLSVRGVGGNVEWRSHVENAWIYHEVKTRRMVLEERIASQIQRLKLKYFEDQSLENPTPVLVPVPPTYQGMLENEAAETEEEFTADGGFTTLS